MVKINITGKMWFTRC